MNKKRNIIIINKETFISSILSDIFTFSLLLFVFWFNYKFIGGNNFIDFLIILSIPVYALKSVGEGSYKGVSEEKIKKIEKILEDKEDD